MTHVKHPKNGEQLDCCICGKPIEEEHGWTLGHNADPLDTGHGRCCDECNYTRVIPARFSRLAKR